MKKAEGNESIILGIDPGTIITGYGLIRINNRKPELLAMGIIKLHKFDNPYQKLGLIYKRIESLILEFSPDEVALEAPFYGKNVQSMLKLGRAQGMAMAPAINRGIPVFEYAPRRIKQAITGNGNASKEQIAKLIYNMLKIEGEPESLDATDGIAAALCHYYQENNPTLPKSYGSWKEFIRKNPGRIK
ncbi:MAG: crossover junction endodeoxyribonuclease RuvC [Bacteroidota bacterium]|nr:crossover junction endodeoxyribonuclease RuvC [Bacteroidota bacterium]